MGADLILATFWEELNSKGKPVINPNWKNGHTKIDELCKEWKDKDSIPDTVDTGDIDSTRDSLHSDLKEIEDAYDQGGRDLTNLDFSPYRIWITGGMSYGDSPTEIFNTISTLSDLNILEAVGFNPGVPDYRNIVYKIAKNKCLQPLLLGIDKSLDSILDGVMRKKARKKRR